MITANKRRIATLFSRAGIHVRPAAKMRPLDLTDVPGLNPIAAVYQGQGRAVLVRAPLSRCLHFNWLAFPCCTASASPFIQTLIEYGRGKCRRYAGSPLEAFYQKFQPSCAADLMGIKESSCPKLGEVPPAGAPLFWRTDEPDQNITLRERDIADENREHRARFGRADGDSFYGPVSVRKGKLEFGRLIKTFDSIKNNGFIVDSHGLNNIRAIGLFSEMLNEWKYLLVSGQHRIAALAALGHADAVVQVAPEGLGGVVRREDAKYWPTVQHGYLSESEAISIFNRIFEGKQPQAFSARGAADETRIEACTFHEAVQV